MLPLVSLHAQDNPGNIAFILDDAGVAVLVVDTMQNSLMTPTLKRNNLQAHFQAEIDAIYQQRGVSGTPEKAAP